MDRRFKGTVAQDFRLLVLLLTPYEPLMQPLFCFAFGVAEVFKFHSWSLESDIRRTTKKAFEQNYALNLDHLDIGCTFYTCN
jgi:hypothetical protein